MLGRGFEPTMFFYYLCATTILRLIPNSYCIKIKTKTSKVLLTYVVTYFKHTCLCMYVIFTVQTFITLNAVRPSRVETTSQTITSQSFPCVRCQIGMASVKNKNKALNARELCPLFPSIEMYLQMYISI
jgi:hypothetical protein